MVPKLGLAPAEVTNKKHSSVGPDGEVAFSPPFQIAPKIFCNAVRPDLSGLAIPEVTTSQSSELRE